MAWTSGIATDYNNLLAIFAAYLDSNGYDILELTSTKMQVRGTGLLGTDEIYWGVETFYNTSSDYYNWKVAGAAGYYPGKSPESQPGGFPATYIYLWNTDIPYWISANGERAILVAKIGTVYQILYMGFAKPIGTKEQYPYPLLVAAMGRTAGYRYSTTGAENAFAAGPATINSSSGNTASGHLVTPGGELAIMNQNGSGSYEGNVYPVWLNKGRSNVVTCLDGSYMLEEILLFRLAPIGTSGFGSRFYPLAMLDSMFKVVGYNNSAENIIQVGLDNYLVVPDAYRSDYNAYFAIKME